MRVITAPDESKLKIKEVSVFLAGGITNCPNWQNDVIENVSYLSSDNLVIFNPRRDNFPINNLSASYEQIEWEFKLLEESDIFSMYFSSGDSDQPICMYELGRNILRMQMKFPDDWENRIVISVEDGYKRKNDVIIQSYLSMGSKVGVNIQPNNDILKRYHSEQIVRAYRKISVLGSRFSYNKYMNDNQKED